jgi:hypothetical protein
MPNSFFQIFCYADKQNKQNIEFTAFISKNEKSGFLKNKSLLIFHFWTFLKMSISENCTDFFFLKIDRFENIHFTAYFQN